MAEISSFGKITYMRPTGLFLKILIMVFIFYHPGTDPVRAQASPGPQAFLPETHFEFPAVFEGQEVYHEFVIRNKSTAPLEITDVRTS